MYKSRKTIYFLCLLLFMILMGSSSALAKENYLDTKSLSEEKQKKDELKRYTIEYGIFERKAPDVNTVAKPSNYILQPMKVLANGENMTIELSDSVINYTVVEKGDVLATINLNEKSTDILETELKLQRLQNNLNRDSKYHQEEYKKKLEEYEKKKKEIEERKRNDFVTEAEKRIYYLERQKEINIERCFLEREALEWENKKRSSERQIQNTKIALEKLQKKAEATTLVAPNRGYVLFNAWDLQSGNHINNGDSICSIMDLSKELVSIQNKDNTYTYGGEYNMQLSTIDGDVEMMGKMINGSGNILYGNLNDEYAFFTFDIKEKELNEMYYYIRMAKVRGPIESIENVLLVPVNAVTVEDDIPYVTVIDEDGSFLKTGFTPGGNNSEYYWVLSGLEEGMQVLVTE